MNEQTLNKAQELLQAVATKMGFAADYFWPLLIRKVYISNAIGIFLGLLFFVGAYISYKKLYLRAEEEENFDPEIKIVLSILLIGLCLLIGSVFFFCSLDQILNPEISALQMILKEGTR